MSDLKIFLVGSTGRMGKALQEVLADPLQGKGFALQGSASGRSSSELKEIADLPAKSIVINFSSPAVSVAIAKVLAKSKAALLECSTGFSDIEEKGLHKLMSGKSWAQVPNTSLGVYLMGELAKVAAEILPQDYVFSLWEAHHMQKKDSPSGTAKLLSTRISSASSVHKNPEIQSVRGGSEAGHHRIDIHGPFERLALEHQAQDRRLFAVGALKLAKILSAQPARAKPYEAAELWKLFAKK
jgi:4-hydroxy-tetrahydrodipicolinate reductase